MQKSRVVEKQKCRKSDLYICKKAEKNCRQVHWLSLQCYVGGGQVGGNAQSIAELKCTDLGLDEAKKQICSLATSVHRLWQRTDTPRSLSKREVVYPKHINMRVAAVG